MERLIGYLFLPVLALQELPDKKIDITVNQAGHAVWYHSPVWIAIGILAAVVILMLIVMAVRGGGGGGTTIIHE
jgi:hypothetical protein